MPTKIKSRDRDTIIQALAAGVVPKIGLPLIQVGRAGEVSALVRDIDRVADGGSSIRFIIGEYGAGKTFFGNLVRLIALERKCVTANADLAPDRRLYAADGQARALYSEAIKNLATRNKPDGGALASIIERFITEAVKDEAGRNIGVEKVIDEKLASLQEFVGGYDFAVVLKSYWKASEENNEDLKASVIRWLRGEYSTKTEARQSVEVRNIIDDENVYDALKIMARFVRIAGYSGLVVMFDEMVNLYKLQNSQARNQNYEQILRIVNDTLQGGGSGIGFIMCGTPEFLLDTRRGLFSYEALQTRLAENKFAVGKYVDFSGPVIRLQNLTPEDVYVLLTNIRNVFASGDPSKFLVQDEVLKAFMHHCKKRIGEAYFKTPRNTAKAFVQLLAVLEQNPTAKWEEVLGAVELVKDSPAIADGTVTTGDTDDELTNLRLGS